MRKIVPIEGTPFFGLEGDTNHLPRAQASKRLIVETEIENLRCVTELWSEAKVLDIGAFVGDTARIFFEQGCIVHAFEPFPDAFQAMRMNCPERNFHLYNVAVGDGIGFISSLEPMENNGNLGTRGLKAYPSDNAFHKTVRIDDLNFPRVNFIKLDVEGFEVFALRGMQKTLQRLQPPVLVEIYKTMLEANGFTDTDIHQFFSSIGYVGQCVIGTPDHVRSDWLFLPTEE